jgi:hypothetical protein
LVRWIVRLSFTAAWVTAWFFLFAAESVGEWFTVSLLIILVPLVMVPMVEAAEGWD